MSKAQTDTAHRACPPMANPLLSFMIIKIRDNPPMGRVTFIEFDGSRQTVEVPSGTSLMTAAVNHGVRGIDADCGGACACATCHIHVAPNWTAIVGPPASETESEMLQFSSDVGADSRLACQIAMRDELDGVVVHVPEAQH
jgi:2Fe-2S ferredoxin